MDCNIREQPWWDDRSTLSIESEAVNSYDKQIFTTPKSICSYLDSKIYGCNDYKKKMSVAI